MNARGRFRVLSPEQCARVVRLALLGNGQGAIAAKLGVKRCSVQSVLVALDVKPRLPLEIEREITAAIVRRTGHKPVDVARFVRTLAARTLR